MQRLNLLLLGRELREFPAAVGSSEEFVVSMHGISASELARRIGLSLPTARTWLQALDSRTAPMPGTLI